MKYLTGFAFVLVCGFLACTEEGPSERFSLLTGYTWQSDSLLANGEDASGPGEMLENFKGKAIFREDGTGVFGGYVGTWRFAYDETQIVIRSDSLAFPLSTNIVELTSASFKITTDFPNVLDPENPTKLRLTFKPE